MKTLYVVVWKLGAFHNAQIIVILVSAVYSYCKVYVCHCTHLVVNYIIPTRIINVAINLQLLCFAFCTFKLFSNNYRFVFSCFCCLFISVVVLSILILNIQPNACMYVCWCKSLHYFVCHLSFFCNVYIIMCTTIATFLMQDQILHPSNFEYCLYMQRYILLSLVS